MIKKSSKEQYLDAKYVIDNPNKFDHGDVARAKEFCDGYEAGQVDAGVIGLLRELAVRTNVVFPQNPKELKWFEEGTKEAYEFHKRLDSFFKKQNQ